MNFFAWSSTLREPLFRWPLFTMACAVDLPRYLFGAAQHKRLADPVFWSWSWQCYCAAMRGAFLEFR